MPDILYFNGRYTTTDERVLGVEDRGFQFGDAIYEVLKFVDRRPVFLREHFERMERCLGDIEIRCPFDRDGFSAIVRGVLERTEFDEGILYMQVSRGEAPRAHFWPEDIPPTVVAYSRRFVFPDAAKRERGIDVITLPENRSRFCHVKSVNLLGNAIAKKAAQRAKADEALYVLDGRIVEGASSSFFGVREGRIVTAMLSSEVLPGVVRQRTIELATAMQIPVEFASIRKEEIGSLDEAFITSTTQGVMPVRSIDGRATGRGTLTMRLQQALLEDELRSAGEAY